MRQVYLYVAASKQLVGCVMVQSISRAYRVVAHSEPAADCMAESAPCPAPAAAGSMPGAARPQQQLEQLRGSPERSRPAGSTGRDSELAAEMQSWSADAAQGTSELGRQHVAAPLAAGSQSGSQAGRHPAPEAAGGKRTAPAASQGKGPPLKGQQTLLSSWLAAANRLQRGEIAPAASADGDSHSAKGGTTAEACSRSPGPAQQLSPAGGTAGSCTKSASSAAAGKENSAAAATRAGPQSHEGLELERACEAHAGAEEAEPCAAAAQEGSRQRGMQCPPALQLAVDDGAPVNAMCGVRVAWVSLEGRRQGIASRLLDLARWATQISPLLYQAAHAWLHHAAVGSPPAAPCAEADQHAGSAAHALLPAVGGLVVRSVACMCVQVQPRGGLCGAAPGAGLLAAD